jgi:2'-5' RNA ligase
VPRLFIAVWPPEEVVDRLRQLPRNDEPGVRWVPPEKWHVTLRFLGDADPVQVAGRLDVTRLTSTTVVLGPSVSRLGRHIVAVPVAGLGDLAAAVMAATADLGNPPDARPFSGHFTLARLRGGSKCGAVGAPVGGEFIVREVALVDSDTSPNGGSKYRIVGRWPTG